MLNEILAAVRPPVAAVMPVDAAKALVDSKAQRGLSTCYLHCLKSAVMRFCEAFADRPLSSISGVDVERFICNPNWSNETRRSALRNIRVFLAFALRRGWVRQNVALDVEWPAHQERPPGILSPDKAAHLLRTCEKVDRPFVSWLAVQLFAGLRVNEARLLHQDQVHERHIEVTAAKAKTRRRRIVDVNPTLRAWLDIGGAFPFLNCRARREAVSRAAGVSWPANCLRHSFVSYSFPVLGARETAIQAGHSESVLFAHYRELVTPEDAARFWAIRPQGGRQMELFG